MYFYRIIFPSVLWHFWLGDRKGIRPVRKSGFGFVGGDDLTGFDCIFARLIAPVVTTTFIVLSCIEIQNGDILVPTYFPGSPGKCPLKQRERKCKVVCSAFGDELVATWASRVSTAGRCLCGRPTLTRASTTRFLCHTRHEAAVNQFHQR